MIRIMLACALAVAGIAGCKQEPASPEPAKSATALADQPATPMTATATKAPTQVHEVVCGCSLEKVGTCGNLIKVDHEFIPLTGDVGLEPMAFCGKDGLRAEVSGEVKDGKFVATSFKLR